jgi:hypothetical protein
MAALSSRQLRALIVVEFALVDEFLVAAQGRFHRQGAMRQPVERRTGLVDAGSSPAPGSSCGAFGRSRQRVSNTACSPPVPAEAGR